MRSKNQYRRKVLAGIAAFAVAATSLVIVDPSLAQASTSTWSSHGPSDGVSQEPWRSVTYGEGIFVAVGQGPTNNVMTSVDGVTWTRRSAPNQQWTSVTYGNGKFVATALSGTKVVMTSDDGVTWVLQDSPTSAWTSVTYGNGLFVAVSESNVGNATPQWIMTSPDGITWTTRTPPAADGQRWSSITYGNGKFVAVADANPTGGTSTHRVMYSADGITWAYGTNAPLNNWFSVTYGLGSDNVGRFVAVAFGGSDRIMTSTDGIAWAVVTDPASKTLGTSDFWYAVGYGGGRFLAATYGSNKIMSSTDGLIWTSETGFANVWRSIAYGSETFVVVSEDGTGNRVERFGLMTPAAPTALSSEPDHESVSISFTPGAANGSSITNYEYSLDGGTTYIALDPVDATSPITIGGLNPGETYTVLIRAVNSFGDGEPSDPLTFTMIPVAVDDSFSGPAGSPLSGSVADNDLAPTGSQYAKVTDPSNGTVEINSDGTFTYTPAAGFYGTDSFTYELCAPAGTPCDNATITLTVTATPITAPAGTPAANPAATDSGQALPVTGGDLWKQLFVSVTLLLLGFLFIALHRRKRPLAA